MNRSFSSYLELTRVVATLMVFLGHGKIFYAPLAAWCEQTNPGRDGVIIFFVLSGYVISWCGVERDKSVGEFAVNRAARIYSVALPALALSFLVSLLGTAFAGQPLDYQMHKAWAYLAVHAGFLGSLWSLSEVPPLNFPFWSLNYEVWYYVLFAAFWYSPKRWRWALVLAVMALVGPKILTLWPLWLAGSALYFCRQRLQMSPALARWAVAGSLAAYVLVKILGTDNVLDAWARSFWGRMAGHEPGEPLLGDLLICGLVVLNFAGAMQLKLSWPAGLERAVRAVASCSFSLYLFHMPIFEAIHWVWAPSDSFAAYVLTMACSGALIAALARITEHKKQVYRAWFARLLRVPGEAR